MRTEIEVTEFTVTVSGESEERPAPSVRVILTYPHMDDPTEFFLDPPEALELADKLRVMALKLGR